MSDTYREPLENLNQEDKKIDLSEIEKDTQTPEKEIMELEKKLVQKKAEYFTKHQKEMTAKTEHQEALRAVIEEHTGSAAAPLADDTAATDDTGADEFSGEERLKIHQLKKLPPEEQIQTLVNLSFQKGIIEAVKIARALNNAYILDALHDKLVDELYQKLITKGELKEI